MSLLHKVFVETGNTTFLGRAGTAPASSFHKISEKNLSYV